MKTIEIGYQIIKDVVDFIEISDEEYQELEDGDSDTFFRLEEKAVETLRKNGLKYNRESFYIVDPHYMTY